MRTPNALKNLDDKVLGRRGRPKQDAAVDSPRETDEVYPDEGRTTSRNTSEPARASRPAGDVVREILGVVWKVARLVFLALALVVFLGIVLTFAPTNDDNTIVSTLLGWAETAAGPFADVFTAANERRELLYNYALATGVYLLAAALVGKLPGKRGVS